MLRLILEDLDRLASGASIAPPPDEDGQESPQATAQEIVAGLKLCETMIRDAQAVGASAAGWRWIGQAVELMAVAANLLAVIASELDSLGPDRDALRGALREVVTAAQDTGRQIASAGVRLGRGPSFAAELSPEARTQ